MIATPKSEVSHHNTADSPTRTDKSHEPGDLLDQVPITQMTSNFPNRVDSDLKYDFYVGKKPPGLSRPVMYINNTKVKKVLNEKILQESQAGSHIGTNPQGSVGQSQGYILDKIKELKSVLSPERKKPVVILDDRKDVHKGYLKFFNDEQSYGFITLEDPEEDIFVYLDELTKAGLTSRDFKPTREGKKLRVRFHVVAYIGKNGKSKKAIDLKVIDEDSTPTFKFSSGKKPS